MHVPVATPKLKEAPLIQWPPTSNGPKQLATSEITSSAFDHPSKTPHGGTIFELVLHQTPSPSLPWCDHLPLLVTPPIRALEAATTTTPPLPAMLLFAAC